MAKRVRKLPTDSGKSVGYWTTTKFGWCTGEDQTKEGHARCPQKITYGECACECHEEKYAKAK